MNFLKSNKAWSRRYHIPFYEKSIGRYFDFIWCQFWVQLGTNLKSNQDFLVHFDFPQFSHHVENWKGFFFVCTYLQCEIFMEAVYNTSFEKSHQFLKDKGVYKGKAMICSMLQP